MTEAARFSVLIGCYGDFPAYSLRAVRTVVDQADTAGAFGVYVGASACGRETLTGLRVLLDTGRIAALVESARNINKDPMMRLLVDLVTTEYFVWLDDDSHVASGWDTALSGFIAQHHPFEAAGHVHFMTKSAGYAAFEKRRPWYTGRYAEEKHATRSWFPTGGFWIGRTAFLRRHGFPDKAMVKKHDDLLLGDLISQHGGKLIDLHKFKNVFGRVRISDGRRRGSGESADEGWLDVDPVTGF